MGEKTDTKNLEKSQIQITGMTCVNCAATIEKGLAETLGVKKASVNFASEKASIEYDPAKDKSSETERYHRRAGLWGSDQKVYLPGGRNDLCRLR